jgi:hypothetical protein
MINDCKRIALIFKTYIHSNFEFNIKKGELNYEKMEMQCLRLCSFW